jgi:hypothetical protein
LREKMTSISAFHKTTKSIASAGASQKAFSLQSGGQRKQNLGTTKTALNLLSGGEPASLLEAFFKTRDGQRILAQLLKTELFSIEQRALSKVLDVLARWHKQTTDHVTKQNIVLAVVGAGLTRKELRDRGFHIGHDQLSNAKTLAKKDVSDQEATLGRRAGAPRTLGKRKRTEELEQELDAFLEKQSHEAANRTYHGKPVRYLHNNVAQLYKLFVGEQESKRRRVSQEKPDAGSAASRQKKQQQAATSPPQAAAQSPSPAEQQSQQLPESMLQLMKDLPVGTLLHLNRMPPAEAMQVLEVQLHSPLSARLPAESQPPSQQQQQQNIKTETETETSAAFRAYFQAVLPAPQAAAQKNKSAKPVLSQSLFYRLVKQRPHFQKARKESDLCELCERGKLAKQRLQRMQNNVTRGIPCKAEDMVVLQRSVQLYEEHKRHANEQRELYRKHLKDPSEGTLVLVADFKEKIKLGGGPRERGQTFFSKSARSVLGITVVYKDKKTKEIVKRNINFVSKCLNNDGLFVRECIDMLLQQRWIQDEGFQKLLFWCDCGPHFRNQEVAYHLLHECFNKKEMMFNQVNINFFWECHGKNVNDSHFSLLSRWQEEIELQQDISSTKEYLALMQKKAWESTENPMSVLFMKHKRTGGRPPRVPFLLLKGILDNHALQAVKGEDYVRMAMTTDMLSQAGYFDEVPIQRRSKQEKRGNSAALPLKEKKPPIFNDAELDASAEQLCKELPRLFDKMLRI